MFLVQYLFLFFCKVLLESQYDYATLTIHSSAASVTSVDQQIGTGGVCTRVTGKVDIGTLKLLGITVTTHWNHAHPQVLDILSDEIRQASVDVAGGDGVNTGKVSPLVGQRLGHVNAAGLGDVV